MASDSLPSTIERARLEMAADWVLRLQAEPLDPADIDAWLEWTGRDPLNLEAFERIQSLDAGLKALPADDKAGLGQRAPAAPAKSGRRRRRGWMLATAASIALIALIVSGAILWSSPAAFTAVYRTARSQHQTFTLPDGTQVELGAGSALRVVYQERVRRVALFAGEAYFRVMHNPGRPFVVVADGVRVKDIGTEFNVRRGHDQVVVQVASGQVQVAYTGPQRKEQSAAASAAARPVRLTAGEQVVADARHRPLTPEAVGPRRIGAWRRGRLQFRDAPLAEVVANINRYAAHPIVITDPAVGRLRYTGTVAVDHIAAWLDAVATVFPVRARVAAGQVRLYFRHAAQPQRQL
ncbi:MAG TPA: FecR domain-containing protein [Gammaproteobacteria bacterium]|nr:FecR domain-containing protein [Gammaproteobacteria bacterium]